MKKAVVFIKGGFGNQLFQLSFANYIREMQYDVKINNYFLSQKNQNTKRTLMFPSKNNGFSEVTYLNKKKFNLFLRLNSSQKISSTFIKKYITQYKFTKEYSSNLNTEDHVIFFNSYWKNMVYVEFSKEYILQVLKNYPLIDKQLKTNITTDRILVHVRRRDFIDNKWELNIGYYQKSLEILKNKVDDLVFDIYTDDPDWVNSHKIFKDAENIYAQSSKTSSHNEQDDFNETISTFASMLNYRHYIISNSSFSFWAAFLSSTRESIVIVPDPWFKNNNHPLLKKENWITVKNV